jgi:hypothetical protein
VTDDSSAVVIREKPHPRDKNAMENGKGSSSTSCSAALSGHSPQLVTGCGACKSEIQLGRSGMKQHPSTSCD